ncbi:hypothetical protein ACJX0J_034873, partial [Zea mays]
MCLVHCHTLILLTLEDLLICLIVSLSISNNENLKWILFYPSFSFTLFSFILKKIIA